MQRDLKLIFNALLFVSIFLDIVFLIFITLDFVLNLKPSILGFIRFDLVVSALIIFHASLGIIREKNKIPYLEKNWIDIFAMLPLAYIVILIFSNSYYIVVLLVLIRIYALFNYMMKIRTIIKFTQKTKLDYATFVLLVTLIFGSIFFFLVESPVNPQASTLDNSLFFMFVTMSTVGYGNIVPYTGIGKIIAVVGIIVGLAYTGWVTAAIATSLIEQLRKERKSETEKQSESLENILKKLEKLDKIENELEEIKKIKNQ
jgi:voltage-gated potassium channel